MNHNTEKSPKKDAHIELFATPEGICAINNPVRIKILSMLKKEELSFDRIVELSGKAKSTVSAHLKRMVDEGVISSKSDPEDARKKIFFIKSEHLGTLSSKKIRKEDIGDYVSNYMESDGNPFEFFRLMFQTLRVALIRQGIEIDPILWEAGNKVGETLYKKVADPDIEKLLGNIAKFWETHHLGRVEVQTLEPLTINVYDCFECRGLPYLGKPACAFDSGILEVIFSKHFQNRHRVDEVKCYAMGDNHCSFMIQ